MNRKRQPKLTFALVAAVISFCLFCHSAWAQTSTVEKWEVVDIPFTLSSLPDNPFHLSIDAHFSHSSGQTLKVPLFYNGDNQYVLRFSASKTGD